MVRPHEQDILNCFRMPIDNGTVESLNNNAWLAIHKAYGFRTATKTTTETSTIASVTFHYRKLCTLLCEEPMRQPPCWQRPYAMSLPTTF